MAEIIKDPELRYLADNQTAVTEMWVEFSNSTKADENAKANLKVVGWRNVAQDIKDKYHKGDRILIEGRLKIDTVERDGYKEKRAELIASRVHPLTGGGEISSSASSPLGSDTTNVVNLETRRNQVNKSSSPSDDDFTPPSGEDLDNIPF